MLTIKRISSFLSNLTIHSYPFLMLMNILICPAPPLPSTLAKSIPLVFFGVCMYSKENEKKGKYVFKMINEHERNVNNELLTVFIKYKRICDANTYYMYASSFFPFANVSQPQPIISIYHLL